MTPEEFRYIKAAVQAIEEGATEMAELKILRTLSQITSAAAKRIEEKLVDRLVY